MSKDEGWKGRDRHIGGRSDAKRESVPPYHPFGPNEVLMSAKLGALQ